MSEDQVSRMRRWRAGIQREISEIDTLPEHEFVSASFAAENLSQAAWGKWREWKRDRHRQPAVEKTTEVICAHRHWSTMAAFNFEIFRDATILTRYFNCPFGARRQQQSSRHGSLDTRLQPRKCNIYSLHKK
jgi:hypothetical protein